MDDTIARAPSGVRRFLHWTSAILVIALIAVGLAMVRVEPRGAAAIEQLTFVFSLHKTVGLVVLLLTLWRLAAMWRSGFDSPGLSPFEAGLSAAIQTVMVLALVAMPLSGLAQHLYLDGTAPIWILPATILPHVSADPAFAARLGAIHSALGWMLIAALALHVAGALKHHFYNRDDVLRRMVSGAPGRLQQYHEPALDRGTLRSARALGAAIVGVVIMLAVFAAAPGGPRAASEGDQGVVTGQPKSAANVNAGDGAQASGPPRWIVDPSGSRIEIRASQGGKAFTARFEKYEADIRLDPQKPETARITVRFYANSFTSGVPNRDETARGDDWLEASKFPVATWTSSDVVRQADGSYRAKGTLNIREEKLAVPVSFSLQVRDGRALAEGSASFDRFDIKLGRGTTGGEDVAGRKIDIAFTLSARQTESNANGSTAGKAGGRPEIGRAHV